MNHILRAGHSFFVSVALFSFAALSYGEDIYVAQSAAGADTGVNAANAHSKAWLDNSSNWGTGSNKVGPGDTVHLVGVITSISAQANGTAGNPITIYFEPGAKLSSPNSDLMSITNRSYLIIDGGTNGILENTDNGTAKKYQTPGVKGINASGTSNITIKNVTIRNLYVHTSVSDGTLDFTTGGGVYANGYGAAVVIENCSFSDICWCIIMFGSPAGNLTVTGCSFVNYDHGIGGVSGTGSPIAGFTATKNHFGSTANWDTTANTYHHDGIHTFWGNGGGIPNAVITGNTFDGDWGINNTAHLFFEQNYNTRNPAEAPGWTITDNIHIQYPGNYLNNGFMVLFSTNATIANNTYVGASVPLQTAVEINGTGAVFKNNLISGVNRFVDARSTLGSAANNIYANVVSGGNTPFRYVGSAVSSITAWKTATGQDSTAQQLSSFVINADGSLPSGSIALNLGIGARTIPIGTIITAAPTNARITIAQP